MRGDQLQGGMEAAERSMHPLMHYRQLLQPVYTVASDDLGMCAADIEQFSCMLLWLARYYLLGAVSFANTTLGAFESRLGYV